MSALVDHHAAHTVRKWPDFTFEVTPEACSLPVINASASPFGALNSGK